MDHRPTVRDLIDQGEERLSRAGLVFGHGTGNARDESAALVLFALGLGIEPTPQQLDTPVAAAGVRQVWQLIEQRIRTRKPAPYLTREAWFAGMPFYVDERVLVPRSPIAELIEQGFSPWIDPRRVTRILELCTGSGCIACACARAFPQARIDATDVSAAALAVAAENIRRHGLQQQIALHRGSVFEPVPETHYEIVVANPPYVAQDELPRLPAEYRHEPALGLAAGADGLDVVVQILAHARAFLADSGILVLEVGFSKPALEALFPQVGFLWLDLEFGGEGVFLLEREQLDRHQRLFRMHAEQRAAGAGGKPA